MVALQHDHPRQVRGWCVVSLTLDGIAYTAALVLAVVFAASAIAKLRDPRSTAEAFAAIGVPDPDSASRLLPLPELAIVVLLLVAPAVGAIAVLVLLAFFTTFLIGRIRAGVSAPCACFGAPSVRPISWLTVARNGALSGLAVIALGTLRPALPTVVDVLVVLGATALGALALRIAVHRSDRNREPKLRA